MQASFMLMKEWTLCKQVLFRTWALLSAIVWKLWIFNDQSNMMTVVGFAEMKCNVFHNLNQITYLYTQHCKRISTLSHDYMVIRIMSCKI